MNNECDVIAAAKFKWLASVFYQVPTKESLNSITEVLSQWPVSHSSTKELISRLERSIEQQGIDAIKQDFHLLFVGPGKKLVYPWGSVYTDEEGLLFGPSTMLWEGFCRANEIEIKPDSNEPTDHFALFFAAIAAILASEYEVSKKLSLIEELLSTHFSPWGEEVLLQITQQASTDYFQCFADLAKRELALLMQSYQTSPQIIH